MGEPLQSGELSGGSSECNHESGGCEGCNPNFIHRSGKNRHNLTPNDALIYLQEIKDTFKDNGEKYDHFLEVMRSFKANIMGTDAVIEEVKKLFEGYDSLIFGFNCFLPKGYEIKVINQNESPANMTVEYQEAFSFVIKLKTRLQNDGHLNLYMSFLHILNMYRMQHKDATEVYKEVSALFDDHPDVLNDFERFLPDSLTFISPQESFRLNGERASVMESPPKIPTDKVVNFQGNNPGLTDGPNDIVERRECIDLSPVQCEDVQNNDDGGPSTRIEDGEEKREPHLDKDEDDKYRGEENGGRSGEPLNLTDCQRCTPSYRRLPDDYPTPSSSCRSELDAHVLNDKWVSVTCGSEDYSFKHMRRNQHEESLFRCEDDRFEMDMLLESVNSTIRSVSTFLDATNNKNTQMDSPVNFEKHFSALNLRCIERLYGDHCMDVMETLRRNPSGALPVILCRLKQRQDEWTRCRSDFKKIWAEVCATNHYKSLDHRSFYFKQQDSKNLSTKALLCEIQEIRVKKEAYDDDTDDRERIRIPEHEFEYLDMDIHGDLHRLVEYSCQEMQMSKDHVFRVMKLWTSFLEPMLGVPDSRMNNWWRLMNDDFEEDERDENGPETCVKRRDDDDDEEEEEGGSLCNVKPLSIFAPSCLTPANTQTFYGGDRFYVLFRLHRVLYERVYSAKVMNSRQKSSDPDDDSYVRFMSSLYGLLDGSIDTGRFEDECRSGFGNESYILFTLDKLMCKLVKQLQSVSADETCNLLLQLYRYENSRRPGKFLDSVYYQNSCVLLQEANIYRFQYLHSPTCLSIQVMDNGNVEGAPALAIDPEFESYLRTDSSSVSCNTNIFLQRNKYQYSRIDEDIALCTSFEDIKLFNGLECKIDCTSSKISYVFGTEDLFIRKKRKVKYK